MEYRAGSNLSFEEARDRRAFEIIGKIAAIMLDCIIVNSRFSLN